MITLPVIDLIEKTPMIELIYMPVMVFRFIILLRVRKYIENLKILIIKFIKIKKSAKLEQIFK